MDPSPSERVAPPLELPSRMAATDALFWYAQQAVPSFRPIIGGLYLLDRPPDPEGLEAGYEAAVARVPRLRQRVVEAPLGLGLPEWRDVAHLDRGYHQRRLSLPAPGSRRQLLDLVASLLASPFDPERPLWEAYTIEGLSEGPEAGAAAHFFKTHHSMVDGVGSLALLDALTQRTRDEKPLRVAGARAAAAPGSTLGGLVSLLRDNARASTRLALQAGRAPLNLLRAPGETLEELGRLVRGLRGVASDLARPPIRDPLAEETTGLSRRIDLMEVSLERLRAIKAPLGVTINDVVLAVLAGALGAYHRERRVRVDTLNCMVPMNLRGRDERDALGNRVGPISVLLPLRSRSPEARLRTIVQQTRTAKRDQRGAAMPFLVQALPLVPGAAFRWLARSSLGRVNVACTNIPGLPKTRYMAGARIEAIHPFASVVQGTPLVVALLSYAGRMCFGIDSDPEAIPDPERIHALLEEGLDEMETLAARPPRRRRRA